MTKQTAIVWFRKDLRLTDNPALAAAQEAYDVIPVYIHAPEDEGSWRPGAASLWWLHQSLTELDDALTRAGSGLVIRRGQTISTLTSVMEETSAAAIFFNRRYEPFARDIDKQVEAAMKKLNVFCSAFDANLLFPPSTLLTKEGKPYRVFTPFWNSFPEPKRPIKKVSKLNSPHKMPKSIKVEELDLLPKIDWTGGIEAAWQPGETGAHKQLKEFLDSGVANYAVGRDRPDKSQVSRMSPHLHFGEISPRSLWHAVKDYIATDGKSQKGGESYLRELAWREFAYNLLFFFPDTPEKPLRPEFKRFPWLSDDAQLKAWYKGKTGYPIVDAGMRELWTTGWMHNRVRMVVASFLVKDLLISWNAGAEWFWDTLVDADLANNTLGWQWTAGCGADAAPYFRVFNPITQGKKFDPDGVYVRKWVPELAKLKTKWLHEPWLAPKEELTAAGITIGKHYPHPIVDHATARKRALEAFATLKQDAAATAR